MHSRTENGIGGSEESSEESRSLSFRKVSEVHFLSGSVFVCPNLL